jgi:hypothetical protein
MQLTALRTDKQEHLTLVVVVVQVLHVTLAEICTSVTTV